MSVMNIHKGGFRPFGIECDRMQAAVLDFGDKNFFNLMDQVDLSRQGIEGADLAMLLCEPDAAVIFVFKIPWDPKTVCEDLYLKGSRVQFKLRPRRTTGEECEQK